PRAAEEVGGGGIRVPPGRPFGREVLLLRRSRRRPGSAGEDPGGGSRASEVARPVRPQVNGGRGALLVRRPPLPPCHSCRRRTLLSARPRTRSGRRGGPLPLRQLLSSAGQEGGGGGAVPRGDPRPAEGRRGPLHAGQLLRPGGPAGGGEDRV